jgi:hypothetical protein
MSGNFQSSHFETPEERLKRMLLECLNDARMADAAGRRKEFAVHIRHFLLLLKADIPKDIQKEIEDRRTKARKEMAAIKANSNLANEVREQQMIDIDYEACCQDLVDGIDSLRNSKIMQREVSGIIIAGSSMADVDRTGKKVRDSDAVETTIEVREGIEDGDEVDV